MERQEGSVSATAAKRGSARSPASGIAVHDGEMFGRNTPERQLLALAEVECWRLRTRKIVALWNNSTRSGKAQSARTAGALYLLKATTSIHHARRRDPAPSPTTARPPMKASSATSSAGPAAGCVGGSRWLHLRLYLRQRHHRQRLLSRDPGFANARAKGIDDYGPFGPVIATGLDPAKLVCHILTARAAELSDLRHDHQRAGAGQQDLPTT